MTLFSQIVAAVLLLSVTLCLQCAGMIALIEWLRRVLTRDTYKHGPTYSAVLVVKSMLSIVEPIPLSVVERCSETWR
jgi:hypothetical protein